MSMASRPNLFRTLVHAYTSFVARTARRMGVPLRDVADVVQEVFRKLAGAMDRGLDVSVPLYRWLERTTCNTAINHLKRAHNAREKLVGDAAAANTPDPVPNPEEHGMKIDVHEQVDATLDMLSHEHRTILVMSDMQEMPMSEVAKILEIPESTGYSRLYAARRAFKAAWDERRKSGLRCVAPFALWEARDLIHAERSIPPAAPELVAEVQRGLGEALGPARPGEVPVSRGQLAAFGAAAMLVGAGLHALLASPARPPSLAADPATVPLVAPPVTIETALVPVSFSAAPVAPSASASAPQDAELSDLMLLDRATAAYRRDPEHALALLAKVKDPRFGEQRDRLRRQAEEVRAARQRATGGSR